MNAKHQFKYTYNEGCEDFSPVEVIFDIPGEVTLSQMLYNFQSYLKACGFVFDGHLEIVENEEIWPADSDGWENEPEGGCMADFDKECGCKTTSSPLETSKWNKAEKMVEDFNKALAKLDNEQKQKCREEALKMSDLHYEATKEVVKNNWVHGMCNPPSPDWKKK